MIAFALGCMCLALAIVYQIQKPHPWSAYFIACLSSIIGCLMLSIIQMMTHILMEDGLAYRIIRMVVSAITIADVVFLVSFFPYFTCWVIGAPWRNPYKAFFLTLSGVYTAIGVLSLISPRLAYSNAMELMFVFDLAFCFAVMMRNLDSIAEKYVRATCITVMIVSVSILPAIGLTLIFPAVRYLMYGIYSLAFSITVMCYLFLHFKKQGKMVSTPKVLTLQDLAEYHITEREFCVITLISQGMTNKEIASQLDISVNTVNNHVANIFAKTKVRSRIDLLNLLKQPW